MELENHIPVEISKWLIPYSLENHNSAEQAMTNDTEVGWHFPKWTGIAIVELDSKNVGAEFKWTTNLWSECFFKRDGWRDSNSLIALLWWAYINSIYYHVVHKLDVSQPVFQGQ